jgi:hypothetical protein
MVCELLDAAAAAVLDAPRLVLWFVRASGLSMAFVKS